MPSTRLDEAARGELLRIAARAVESGFEAGRADVLEVEALPPALRAFLASFVTLTVDGSLRGCCGTLEARRPLAADVWHNALASAFRDPRFEPLSRREWPAASLEVSILSPHEALDASTEAALEAALVPGLDGLVLEWRGQRATFLPKVWEQLPDRRQFLRHLKAKAGWAPGFWAADIRAWRYRAEVVAVEHPARLAGGT